MVITFKPITLYASSSYSSTICCNSNTLEINAGKGRKFHMIGGIISSYFTLEQVCSVYIVSLCIYVVFICI